MMNPDGQYTRSFSRRYPGLFIILLDQSKSMTDSIAGEQYTKADYATTAINTIIQEMINAAGLDEEGVRKKYAYLSILGYNNDVYPLLYNSYNPIDIPYLAENYLAKRPMIVRQVEITPGKFRQITEERPLWIKPQASGKTQMDKAFIQAKEIALGWINSPGEPHQADRRDCFPPVIINITDAKHNGDGNHLTVSREIRMYGTNDGKILIFNCHLTETLEQPCIFPGNIKDVENLDEYGLARTMFKMSSTIPQLLRPAAEALLPSGQKLPEDARCLVYNANPDILIKFLRWGTQARQPNKV